MKKFYSFRLAIIIAFLILQTSIIKANGDIKAIEFSQILSLNLPQKALTKIGDSNSNFHFNDQDKISSKAQSELFFIRNNGQLVDDDGKARPDILYYASAKGVNIYIGYGGISYVFSKFKESSLKENSFVEKFMDRPEDNPISGSCFRFDVKLNNSNFNPAVEPSEMQDYYEMHYRAGNSQGVRAESYKKIKFKNIYPGVDWVIYSNGPSLKYDFEINDVKNVSKINLKVEGADVRVDGNGNLIMHTPLGEVIEDAPKTYQEGKLINSNFVLKDESITFKVAGATGGKPLTIDPAVMWSTYFMENTSISEQSYGLSCKTDKSNNIITTGFTNSNSFPVLSGIQMIKNMQFDAVIMKYNSIGQKQWATFYGGSSNDYGYSCDIDDSSNIYLTGSTESQNFPIQNANQVNQQGLTDAFIISLNPNGTRRWATFLGGSEREIGNACAVDKKGNLAVVGFTVSVDFPTLNPIQNSRSVGEDGYIAYYNKSGTKLWATYFGGNGYDAIKSCTIDPLGNVYYIGITGSSNLTTISPYQSNFSGGTFDAFIGKFSRTGNLEWSTYYGGSDFDFGYSCNTDKRGNLYVSGHTFSNNFPTLFAAQPTRSGDLDAYASKFSASGTLLWSTYYGGTNEEIIFGSSLDTNDNFSIVGRTSSNNLPVLNPVQSILSGGTLNDAFFASFKSNGIRRWSSYFGGTGVEVSWSTTVVSGIACAADNKGSLIITGNTGSNDFPVNNGLSSPTFNSANGFLVKIDSCIRPSRPSISSSGPLSFCDGDSVILSGPPGFNYLWSNGETTRTIKVNNSGSFTLQIENGLCRSIPSFVSQVSVFPHPTIPNIQITGDTSLCSGDSVILSGPPNAVYFWSNNATSRTISVKDSGSYRLRVSVNGCVSGLSKPVVVKKAPLPPTAVIFPSGPTTFCTGDSVILAAEPGFRYLWSNGDTAQSTTVKATGNYSVQILNGRCISEPSRVLSIVVNPIPQAPGVVAGGPTFFCLGDSVVLTADSSQGYLWSNGATTRSIAIKRGGDYSVKAITNGCISQASQSITVTVYPPERPEIIASGPVNICAGDSVVLSAPSGFMYLWSNNAVSESVTIKASGTFTVSTIASGCTSTVSEPVTVNVTPIPSPVSISAGGPTGFCLGDSVVLTAAPSSGYLWSNGATTQSITVKRGGLFKVRAANNNCFSDTSNSIRVMVSPPEVPEITPLGATDFCTGDSIFLMAPAGLEYIWSTNEITQTIKVKTSGTYTVKTILNNCTSTVSPPLQINVIQTPIKPSISADGPVNFCKGGSVKLNASSGSAHLWSTGETSSFIEVNEPGRYFVQSLNSFCLSPISDTITVIVRDTSRTVTGANVCQGTVIPFGNTLITSTGIYKRVLTNAFGCDSTIVFDALVIPIPTLSVRYSSTGVRSLANGPRISHKWVNNLGVTVSTTDSLHLPANGIYTLIVTDSSFGLGCADTTTFFVRSITKSLTSSLKVYPNPADNLIKVEGLQPESELFLYSPLGIKLTADINHEGYINTRDLPAGVYFLVINSGRETQTFKVSIKH